MIYYNIGDLIIRDLMHVDAEVITAGEIAQGWHTEISKYEQRLRDQKEGLCISLVAEFREEAAGYVNIYPNSPLGAFGGRGLPEIVDLGVLEKYRHKGIGTALMDEAEKIAAGYAEIVYLAVGLHSGYGNAQRMYVKRGYEFDGSGAWYRDSACNPYGLYPLDDELVLYMSKRVKNI